MAMTYIINRSRPNAPSVFCRKFRRYIKELRVDEYLRYCAQLRRVPNQQLADSLDMAKQRCGLTDVGKRVIGLLSKGYQQRIGIAQAIIHSPAVVVLDEPTVGLDPIQIHAIRQLIRDLGQDHCVILSTHILPEVEMVCDRVQIMHQGRLVYNAALKDLQQSATEQRLLLHLNRPPALAELQAIAGVSEVIAQEPQRFSIQCTDQQNATEQLIALSISQGWQLQELRPEQLSLEALFMQLTDNAKATPAATE